MPRLLVVADRTSDGGDSQRRSIREAGLEAGFQSDEIICPESWDDAVRAIRDKKTQPFLAAVIDIDLWGAREGGVDLTRELHIQQPACFIIAVTERRGDDALQRATQTGASDFLNGQTNPFWLTELQEQLHEQLSLYRNIGMKGKQRVN